MKLLFSKKAKKQSIKVALKDAVKRRLYRLIESTDPLYDPNNFGSERMIDEIKDLLLSEHGWEELKSLDENNELVETHRIEDFITHGAPNYVFDAIELYFGLYSNFYQHSYQNIESPYELQKEINRILSEADLPWRMIEGSIIKVDSEWIENEIMEKAYLLIKANRFEGALHELEEARADLLSGDTKGCILNSGKAFESVLKPILDSPSAQPRDLIRGAMELGIIPDYYDGFLKSFENNILNSVIKIRNKEQGVSHGQGETLNVPPESLAQLALHLTGVLVFYLISRYQEIHPPEPQNKDSNSTGEIVSNDNEVPF